MNSKINLKHGYTLVFNDDDTFCLKAEAELEFDGIGGDIIISSEPVSEETAERMTLGQMTAYSTEFFRDWGIYPEAAEAIVKDLTPWFEKFAVSEV